MSDMTLAIVTPEGKAFDDTVTCVTAPGTCGSFQVLRQHAALVAALQPGVVNVQRGNGEHLFFAIGEGFLDVHDNTVTILTDQAEAATDLTSAAELVRKAHPKAVATTAATTPAHV